MITKKDSPDIWATLDHFSTEELVEELKKREGVGYTFLEPNDKYCLTATFDFNGTAHVEKIEDIGPVTILIITD